MADRGGTARAIEFHPDKLSDFIMRQGQRVYYERAYRCPCFDLDSYNKAIGCTECDVDGYRYECQVPMIAIITGIQDMMDFTQVGELKQGDAIGGFHSNVPIAFHDRVTLFMKKVREEAFLLQDDFLPPRIKDHRVCQLDRARTMDKIYYPYTDYQLDTDGRTIIWMDDNNRPATGDKFTIQYWHMPVYVVWQSIALERHSEDKNMPRHVILRRKDDFGNDLGIVPEGLL